MSQIPRSFSKEPQPKDYLKTAQQHNLQEMVQQEQFHPSVDSSEGDFKSDGVDEDYYTQE